MTNFASRLGKLERAIGPALEPVHVLRVIVDPDAPGDRVLEVLARGEAGSLTQFVREPGESEEALCKRAARAMGWES